MGNRLLRLCIAHQHRHRPVAVQDLTARSQREQENQAKPKISHHGSFTANVHPGRDRKRAVVRPLPYGDGPVLYWARGDWTFFPLPPHPNPPPQGGREQQGSLPPCGGGSNKAPSPLGGEGATRLPPPLWGRVGVGGMVLPPPWWGGFFSLPPGGGGLGWGGEIVPH